ncbi:dipeptidase [Arachnia propionica]|jgi:zinc metallopeptidase|uniref:Succinyl-diaminopimelate desuccinylase n=1 Tax=Arachnia propionica TaxID=1750 RepID=A0A3S5ESU6_9ACTN|nr:dipeptidase [Arachnia propionica]QUC13592.1 dipeptidase [Arachnia propionica]VEH71160.1 Succinyl-diaminopimelate desuccinylase [Arachnia propionica]VEJ59550.1 Succinyl-diaminopimelate desuccinylase [Arachnia propionica]
MTNLAWNVERVLPSAIADLHRLISIPSISSMPEHDADVAACADAVSGLFRDLGASEVKLLDGGGKPAVWANFPGPEGTPTVLLYAHYDVQPTGDTDAWTSPAFEPTERDGRLYARGSADDKGGVALHVAALRVFDGKPPVGVKVFIEGEEEVGSPSMPTLLDRYRDELAADVYVVADSVNWEVGKPSLTTSLRGVADCQVTVSTLAEGLHSGQFGGVVPDALTALCRLLATLHDDAGNVAIEGLVTGTAPDLDYPEDRLLEETGLLEGVSQIGDGSVVERMWFKPAASVLAIDATPVAKASNTLIPSARAKVSVRLVPGQDPAAAAKALEEHLRRNAPWGAHVDVVAGQCGAPGRITLEGERAEAAKTAFREAFGVDAVEIGCGGSIPIVAEFADRNPDALVLVTAVTDPNSRMHGIDESLDLGDFAKAALAETLLLNNLAG